MLLECVFLSVSISYPLEHVVQRQSFDGEVLIQKESVQEIYKAVALRLEHLGRPVVKHW